MRRLLLLFLTFALAAATGLALLGAGSTLSNAPVDAPADTASKDAVRRFYDAVNAALATGDTAYLAEIVDPDFFDHEPVLGLPSDRAGLVQHLTTLRAAFPHLRLTAEALTAEGDQAMARVTVSGAEEGIFLGIPLAGQLPLWGRVERFRVAGGRIAERWADGGTLGLLEPLQQARAEIGRSLRRVVAVERFTVAPGALLRRQGYSGQHLLYVESGALTVRVDAESPFSAPLVQATGGGKPSQPEPLARGTDVTLAPGQLLILADDAACLIHGREGAPAVVWVVSMTVAHVSDSTAAPSWQSAHPELTPRVLAGDWMTKLPEGLAATVAIGRVTLPRGAALPPHQVAAAELLVVEAGTLALATTGGKAWVRRGATGYAALETETMLSATDGAHVPAGAVGALRNAGDEPLVVLIVTITPVDAR